MGFLAPVFGAIAGGIGAAGSAIGSGLTALGTAATAGAATGTAATVIGGVSAASTLASAAGAVGNLAAGKPKMPTITAPTAAKAPPSIGAAMSPTMGVKGKGGGLASLVPGLALGGTASGPLGALGGLAKKTLLGS